MLNPEKAVPTFEIPVLVRFQQEDGSAYDGDFVGVFERVEPKEAEKMLDEEWSNLQVVERVMKGAKKIGKTPSEELSPADGLAFVKTSMECVNASAVAFLKSAAPERMREKTSGKRR
jgi:hypothetical protein